MYGDGSYAPGGVSHCWCISRQSVGVYQRATVTPVIVDNTNQLLGWKRWVKKNFKTFHAYFGVDVSHVPLLCIWFQTPESDRVVRRGSHEAGLWKQLARGVLQIRVSLEVQGQKKSSWWNIHNLWRGCPLLESYMFFPEGLSGFSEDSLLGGFPLYTIHTL